MSDFGMNLDVVNSNGNITSVLPSEEVHRKGLLHKAVHILLVNEANDIYVRKRSENLELYPGIWSSSVGEHVFQNETTEMCAQRALKDFLGLAVPVRYIGRVHILDEIENELMSVYTGVSESIPMLNPEHSEEGHFLSLDELEKYVREGNATPHLRAAVRLFSSS